MGAGRTRRPLRVRGGRDEGATDFHQLGINLTLLGPGEPMAMYHREIDQEGFLVLRGEAVLVIEGQERSLGPWDFVHCPPGTEHTIVGAGEAPCLVLCVGGRDRSTAEDWGAYTVDPALPTRGRSGRETTSAREAYARFPPSRLTGYREGWLWRRSSSPLLRVDASSLSPRTSTNGSAASQPQLAP